MPNITVTGEVIHTIGQDLGVRVDNADELRAFWATNEIDTELNWFDSGAPVASIGRQQDIAVCAPGDSVSMTLETVDRENGRGTRTIGFRVL